MIQIDAFHLPGPVQHLAIDSEENAMLAVLPGSKRLQKIDLISKQPRGNLELETDSQTVVVMGER